jgi:hypothetical protein
MENSNRLERPILNISINGIAVNKHPSSLSLMTDEGIASVVSFLKFPADAEIGKSGDPVTVSLSLNDEKHLLFTGEVLSAGIHGAYRDLILTDGYSKLFTTPVTAAYRKETAAVILQDTLDKAGIKKTAITCPAVEIARFSTEKITAFLCIKLLIKTLKEHGHTGFRFFFDAENTFRFGTAGDTGKNESPVYEFETGKNILKKGIGKIEVLPLPIRHSQEVAVDGVSLITRRTDLSVSGSHSRLALWLRTAENNPVEAA